MKRQKNQLKPYISNLTAKGYSSLFTGGEGKVQLAYIDPEHKDSLEVKKNGEVKFKPDPDTPINFQNLLKPIIKSDVELPLLQAVYGMLYQSVIDQNACLEGSRLTIHKNMLARYMGLRADAFHHNDFFYSILKLNNVYGHFKNGSVGKFLTLLYYDTETEVIEFDVTLLVRLLKSINQENTITVQKARKKEFTYVQPTHSFLVHSKISKRNKNAYFLVTQIEALLVQAGDVTKEQPVKEIHIKFEKLIDQVPSLLEALENKTTADQNKYLKRAFTKMYELLRTSTDLYLYFKELDIPELIPTQSNLDEVLRMTHKGIDKNYKQSK